MELFDASSKLKVDRSKDGELHCIASKTVE